jgi:hypothetical protein
VIVLLYELGEDVLYGEIAATAQEIELDLGAMVSVRILEAREEARSVLG